MINKCQLWIGFSLNRPNLSQCAIWNPDAITFADSTTIGSSPVGLFVDVNNSVYVTDKTNNRVQVWLEGNNTVARTISRYLGKPASVFVSIDGNVYIDNHCEGLFVDTNSTLYCSMPQNHQVMERSLYKDLTTTTVTVAVAAGIGSPGSASNMLNNPRGIFVDVNFDLYVADAFNHRIQRFHRGELNGTSVAGAGASGTLTLNFPSGVALDANGFLFIVDTGNNRIIRLDSLGFRCIAGCSGTSGSGSNQLYHPRTMSFDSYGNMFVSDTDNNRIQKFILDRNYCGESNWSIFLLFRKGFLPVIVLRELSDAFTSRIIRWASSYHEP